MRAGTKCQAQKWGFDFENDAPLGKEDLPENSYEWSAVPCKQVPDFYRRPIRSKSRPECFELAVHTERTPSKRRGSTSAATKMVSPGCATLVPTTISVALAPVTDSTPFKPASDLTAGVSPEAFDDDQKAESSMTSPKLAPKSATVATTRRKTRCGQQTELTHFYPLRKRSRRNSSVTGSVQIEAKLPADCDRPANPSRNTISSSQPSTRTSRNAAAKVSSSQQPRQLHRPSCFAESR